MDFGVRGKEADQAVIEPMRDSRPIGRPGQATARVPVPPRVEPAGEGGARRGGTSAPYPPVPSPSR